MPGTRLSAEHRAVVARMRKVAARFRAKHPLSTPRWTAGSFPLAVNFDRNPDTLVLAWFRSPGCTWSRSGGCTMCDLSSLPDPGSVEAITQEFQSHLAQLDTGTRRLHLGPGGSFFDRREVPLRLRRAILESLGRLPFLRSVSVETRPNVMTPENLADVLAHLPTGVQDLSIGFGLECLDSLVREITINKGYGPRELLRAFGLLEDANLSQARIHVEADVYVLLKPMFVSEAEAIDKAVRTIDWSYAHGAATVVLFMNTVKRNTIQGYLARRDDLAPPLRYQPPYYRSAVQVLRELPSWQRIRTQVVGVQSGILAERMPRGCQLCSPFLLGALTAHNFTRDPAVLDQAAASWCPCKASWRAELDEPQGDLLPRIVRGVEELERAFGS